MMTFLLIIHLFITIGLVGLVLLQRSEGGGLGISGGSGGFMTTRGTANALTRATVTLATLFFITSITLSILAGLQRGAGRGTGSVTDAIPASSPAAQDQPIALPDQAPDETPADTQDPGSGDTPADTGDDGLPPVPDGN